MASVGGGWSAPRDKPLSQLNVRQVDRYNKRISVDASIRLASKDAVHRGKLDPGNVDVVVDIVCARCVPRDFHVVVMALQESRLIDIKRLLGTVSGDAVGKMYTQAPPAFSIFFPLRKLFSFDTRPTKNKGKV
jgi:hypothetical protein